MAILNDNTILQYLDSLLKYNSFTKASEDLYISQPYLTQVSKKPKSTSESKSSIVGIIRSV